MTFSSLPTRIPARASGGVSTTSGIPTQEDGDLDHDADKIEDVYGADEEEWEAAANAKLAEYGFKLGDFDEKAGDRYTLVED